MMCTTVLHGGVCHRTSTPHKSGIEMKEREKREKKFLFKVEQNGKYNTSEFAITSTSHTICTT